MANRALTVAEVKAMLDNLADKITEEGAELYQDITSKVNELSTATAARAEVLAQEIGPKLEELKATLSEEGQEIIDAITARVNLVMFEVQEELAELKEVGLVEWIKANPMYAGGIAVVVVAIVLGIAL